MRKMYALSVILFLGLVLLAGVFSGGTITTYLNVPSFIIVAGCTFILLLGNFSLREMGTSFAIGFKGNGAAREDLKAAYVFFRTMQTYLVLSGILGSVVGIITMLANLKDSSAIGFGTALALTTVLYGLILVLLVALPFRTGIRKQLIYTRTADNQ